MARLRSSSSSDSSSYRGSSSGSSSSGSYTSSSDSTTTSSSNLNIYGATDSYWTTDKILARNAARSAGQISAPPNSTTTYEPKRSFTPYVSLGPVIGMVTDTTARILIETSATCNVKCFLTDKYGVQHGCIRKCVRHVPTVFIMEELRANTYYKVTFDIPVPGLVKSGFKTLSPNWSLAKSPARVGIVATNDFACVRDEIAHKNDLWRHLYSQCKKGQMDYLFHLGNIAVVDHQSTSKKSSSDYAPSAYDEALEYCEGLHGDLLAEAESRVCEMFRNIYRDTWMHPTTRHVLANVPNLMILNDHEIKANLGEEEASEIAMPTHRSYINFCAYRVYNEYCRALFEDVPFQKVGGGSLSSAMKVGQAYHFHAFGDMGFAFIDTRAQRTLHKDWTSDDNLSFLGSKQWSDLDYALSAEGYLADCRVLLVCMATPLAQCGEQAYLRSGTCKSRDKVMQGSWNSPSATGEASLLLSKLFDWKAQKPGRREVVIMSGSSTDAGVTEIVDLRYKAKGDTRVDRIKQITAGPTGALPNLKAPAKLSNAKCGVNGLGIYHQFKHLDIVKRSNYALVDIDRPHAGDNAVVETYHVSSAPKGFLAKKQKSNTYRAGGCWAAEPDDAGVRGIRHTATPTTEVSHMSESDRGQYSGSYRTGTDSRSSTKTGSARRTY